jgi:cytochrome P450
MRSVVNKVFLTGRWSCVGQKLAMMTMRMFLAYTLWNCDFDFAAGEDGVAVHRDAKNVLIVRPGKLELVFHTR